MGDDLGRKPEVPEPPVKKCHHEASARGRWALGPAGPRGDRGGRLGWETEDIVALGRKRRECSDPWTRLLQNPGSWPPSALILPAQGKEGSV